MLTVYERVVAETDLTPNAGESFESFAERVCDFIRGLKDKQWNALTEELQNWYNSAIVYVHKREKLRTAGEAAMAEDIEIPEMDGFEPPAEVVDASEAQEIAAAAANGKAEPSPKEKRIAAKLARRAVPAPKAVKAAVVEPLEVKPTTKKSITEESGGSPIRWNLFWSSAPHSKSVVTEGRGRKASPAAVAVAEAEEQAPVKSTTAPSSDVGKKKPPGRPMRFSTDSKIKILVDGNPHYVNSKRFQRWKLYKDGMTVGAALKAGLRPVDIHHSQSDGHIRVTD
jgi:hypothetical protein